VVIASCSVDYDGRLTAHLPLATRLLMVKADGSVLIHSDGGSYKPLNWMSPPCAMAEVTPDETEAAEGVTAVWVVQHAKSEDRLRIRLHEVHSDTAHDLGVDPGVVARDLLPAMQAAKPRPALTFTYDRPIPPASPDYRLVLVFDPANDLNADPVCAGDPPRFQPGKPGRFYVYAIYCRNDRAMSFTTAWTQATGPNDPRIEQLFRELFMVIFTDQQQRFAELNPMLIP